MTFPRLTAIIVLIFLSLPFSERSFSFNPPRNPLTAKVVSVTDGDTIVVNSQGIEARVRLIGIDCPETEKRGKNGEYLAEEAKEYVSKLLEGKNVRLEFDFEEEDHYGRWLCYVYTEDGKMVNEMILREGLALVMTRFPFRKKEEFRRIQVSASEEGKGLFSHDSADVILFSEKEGAYVSIIKGPSYSYILRYREMAKPWLFPRDIPEEIDRIRRYEKKYPSSQIRDALKTDGYISRGKSALSQGKRIGTDRTDGAIDYRDAPAYVGSRVTVVGRIVRTKRGAHAAFLNFNPDWRHTLSLVIFEKNFEKFPSPPHIFYRGKTIRIRGKVILYKGKPEIIVNSPEMIKILK